MEVHPYQAQWQAFRKHKQLITTLVIIEFGAFIPLVAVVSVLDQALFHTRNMAFPAALFWGAIYATTFVQFRRFPCPRCGHNFFGGFFATPQTVMAKSCAHCGL